MKPAYLKDKALEEAIEAGIPLDGHLTIWWLGQSGFLICAPDSRLLFDPYLSDSLTRKYADTDKPHVRMTEQVIRPERLKDIAVVTSSHNHTDHLDAETLLPLRQANPDIRLALPEANIRFAANRLGGDTSWMIGLNDGQSVRVGPWTIHGVPSAHDNLDRNELGQCLYMGFVVSIGPWTLYHSGDTLPYPGMEDLLTPFDIDIALLPINGRKPERRVAGNLDGQQAVTLAHNIQASTVIPCHYDMFEFNTESTELFESTATSLNQPVTILRNGQCLSTKSIQLSPKKG